MSFYLVLDPDRLEYDPLVKANHKHIRSIYKEAYVTGHQKYMINKHIGQYWYVERGIKLKIKERL